MRRETGTFPEKREILCKVGGWSRTLGAFLLFCCLLLPAGAAELVFSPVSEGWSRTDTLSVGERQGGLVLTGSGHDAKIYRSVKLEPGRTYRLLAEGHGDLTFKLTTGWGKPYLLAQQLGRNETKFSARIEIPEESPGDYLLIVQIEAKGGKGELRSLRLSPLPDNPRRVRLKRDRLLAERPRPERVRGFACDHLPGAEVIRELAERGVTLLRFRFNEDTRDFGPLRDAIGFARKNGIAPTVEFQPDDWKSASSRLDELWRNALRELGPAADQVHAWGLAVGKKVPEWRDEAEKLLAQFRRIKPEAWVIYQPGPGGRSSAFDRLNPLADYRVIYSGNVVTAGEVAPIVAFLKRCPVPFLATTEKVEPELITLFEKQFWPWSVDTENGASAFAAAETLRRPLIKGAGFDARFESLKREFLAARKPGTLNFGIITDTHYQRSDNPRFYGNSSLRSMRNFARMGRELKLDFLAHCGDMVDGNSPKALNTKQIIESVAALLSGGPPVLVAIGNHDDGTYYCRTNSPGGAEAVTNAEWHTLVTRQALEQAVGDPDNPAGNYCYQDFPDAKVRVIVLAVSDNPLTKKKNGHLKYYSIGTFVFTDAQLNWMAKRALDFKDRADRSEWSVLVISHVPPGRQVTNGQVMADLLEAFRQGKPFESTPTSGDFGQHVTCDFSAQGPMRVLAALHGHYHRDGIDYSLGYPRIGFLNGLCYRNGPDRPPREYDGPDEESWTILSLDPAAGTITGWRFGAGNDFSYPLEKR